MKNDSSPSCQESDRSACLAIESHTLSNGMELRRTADKRSEFVLISDKSVLVPDKLWNEVTSQKR